MRRYQVVGKGRAALWLFTLLFYAAAAVLGAKGIAQSIPALARSRDCPIYSVAREEKLAAITINCAWDENNLPQLLEILERENVKATFFMVGQWVEQYPQTAADIAAAGHEIGNHSYSHPDFRKRDAAEIEAQLRRTDALIREACGVTPKLVRVPSGDYDGAVISTVRGLGYEVIQWDVDSRDWMDPSAEEIVQRVTEGVQCGSILLFHAGKRNTEEALPEIIARMKGAGYRFVTVGELVFTGEYTLDTAGRQHQKS